MKELANDVDYDIELGLYDAVLGDDDDCPPVTEEIEKVDGTGGDDDNALDEIVISMLTSCQSFNGSVRRQRFWKKLVKNLSNPELKKKEAFLPNNVAVKQENL